MKKMYLALPLALAMLLVVMAGQASASALGANFTAPLTAGTISGSYVLSVNSSLIWLANCSVTASSAASGDTLPATLLINRSAVSANATLVQSVALLNDASDWVFTGTCQNVTGQTENINSVTAVVVDNSKPVISGCTINSVPATTTQTVTSYNFVLACTVANATTTSVNWQGVGTNANAGSSSLVSCTSFPSSGTYFSGAAFSCTGSGAASLGANLYVTATDGLNATTGSTYSVLGDQGNIVTTGNTQNGQSTGTTTTTTTTNAASKSPIVIIILAVAMLLLVGAAIYIKKK